MAKGAILIGYGSLPTKADIEDAIKSGWIKNVDTVSVTSFPTTVEPNGDLHAMTYIQMRREKGWDNPPGGIQTMKITTADGRTIYSVYPLGDGKPVLSKEEIKARVHDYHKPAHDFRNPAKKKKW